jgi:ATP-binding cassette subfamily C protein CydC
MMPVLRIMRLLVAADPWAMARGAALAILVLIMGAALLGLSGWFITATGLAGLAGVGIAFDVFRPSAGVRFLALGRTAARYGERLLTHDATLRALAALRVSLLRRQARLGARALMRLRSEYALTRIVSDVDALDGLVLRLLLPVAAALVTQAAALVALTWIVGPPVALTILVGYVPVAALILWHLARRTLGPSDIAERESQNLRRGIIDMIRDRVALILCGRLAGQEERLVGLDEATRKAAAALDRAERNAGLTLSILVTVVSASAFFAGGQLLALGAIGPAGAVIGLFVALALAETILPLRRGFMELGRMIGAARRVSPDDDRPIGLAPAVLADAPVLEVSRPDIRFRVGRGQALALTGPSGSGKSTLLNAIAGLENGAGISIAGRAPVEWEEISFRDRVTLLPQRSALIAGTIRDNLSLAGRADDETLWAALDAVALTDTIRARGGLDARLGEGGSGLSGGQARRLALARVLLRKPDLLLLDEPTEGLDPATADAVLNGIRRTLPQAAIVAALHRGTDHAIFDEVRRLAH